MKTKKKIVFCTLAGALLVVVPGRAEPSQRIKDVLRLIKEYRKASDTIQEAAADRRIAYCVYREWNAGKPDPKNLKLPIGVVSGARNGIAYYSGQQRIDEIVSDSMGGLAKRVDIPVASSLSYMSTMQIPLDTDTFRVLRQTAEYDRQNRTKFDNYAGGLEKLLARGDGGDSHSQRTSGAAQSLPLQKISRLHGPYGFGGLAQTVGYVQRDFTKEFDGKKMLNFGKCAGAGDRVLAIGRAIQKESELIHEIVGQLQLDSGEM